MLTSTLAIILSLGGLIFFHELGHFAVARFFKMGVKAFSLGFGPKLVGFTSGKTDYKISLIPLGGFVALAGETGVEEDDALFNDEELFSERPAWQRMCVVAAGPFFNFLLAFILYWVLGLAQGQAVILPTVGGIMPDSPAAHAGFQMDDKVVSIDNEAINTWSDMVTTIRAKGEKSLSFEVERNGATLHLTVTPKLNTTKNIFGETVTAPMVGISQGHVLTYIPVSGTGIKQAIDQTWNITIVVVKGFVSIVERLIPIEQVGGPIMLAQMIHSSAQSSVFDLLAMIGLISINLGVINLLPIPVLDGGHILFFGLEMITRRPLNDKWKSLAMRFGIFFLLMIMGLVIFNDLRRLFS